LGTDGREKAGKPVVKLFSHTAGEAGHCLRKTITMDIAVLCESITWKLVKFLRQGSDNPKPAGITGICGHQ